MKTTISTPYETFELAFTRLRNSVDLTHRIKQAKQAKQARFKRVNMFRIDSAVWCDIRNISHPDEPNLVGTSVSYCSKVDTFDWFKAVEYSTRKAIAGWSKDERREFWTALIQSNFWKNLKAKSQIIAAAEAEDMAVIERRVLAAAGR